MQRFVDRRTSALMRGLEQSSGPTLGGIAADGAVIVEGHAVGRLIGLHFERERGASPLEARALRGAVDRAVAPEISRRLAEIAGDDRRGVLAEPQPARSCGAATPSARSSAARRSRRRCGSTANSARRRRASARSRRLEKFVAEAARARHSPGWRGSKRRRRATRSTGLARGLAYQLVEAAGAAAAPRRRGICARALPRRAQGVARPRRALRRLHDLCRGPRRAGDAVDARDLRRSRRAALAPDARLPRRRARRAEGSAGLSRPARRRRASPRRSPRWSGSATSPAPPRPDSRCTPERWRNSAGARRRRSGCCAASASSRSPRRRAARPSLWRRRGPARPPARPTPRRNAGRGGGWRAGEPCRIDVWLWRARFCKTRALAAKRVAEGEVAGMRQGEPIALDKPSRHIRAGDVLTLAFGGRSAALRVRGGRRAARAGGGSARSSTRCCRPPEPALGGRCAAC